VTTSAAGLPRIRLHDVRHSYATAALAAGVPAKVVSERLGHANIAITMDTYSHVLPGLDELAAGTLARLILGDNDQASARPIDKPLTTGRTASEDGEEVKREPLVNDGASGGTRTHTRRAAETDVLGVKARDLRFRRTCGDRSCPLGSPGGRCGTDLARTRPRCTASLGSTIGPWPTGGQGDPCRPELRRCCA